MTAGLGETVRGAEPTGARASVWLRRFLAALVVVAWVAWAVPSWMSSLDEVQPRQLAADVGSGRITGYQVVTNVRPEALRFSALGGQWYADVPAADSDGRPLDGPPREVVYTVEGAPRTRWVRQAVFLVGDRDAFTAMVESGARPFTPETFPPARDWAAYPALFAFLMSLVGLVALSPTRGTRPFWVLTGSVGMGLGLVAYAVAELWWPRTSVPDDPSPEGEDVEHRLRWLHGLGVAVVGGLIVATLRALIT